MILPVYVPKKKAVLGCHIAPSSGIVGKPIDGTDLIKVYFEGNVYDACNLNTYLDRLTVASGRCAQNAPTVAFSVMEENELIVVGEMDTDSYHLTLFNEKKETISTYIGDMPISPPYRDYKVSILSMLDRTPN